MPVSSDGRGPISHLRLCWPQDVSSSFACTVCGSCVGRLRSRHPPSSQPVPSVSSHVAPTDAAALLRACGWRATSKSRHSTSTYCVAQCGELFRSGFDVVAPTRQHIGRNRDRNCATDTWHLGTSLSRFGRDSAVAAPLSVSHCAVSELCRAHSVLAKCRDAVRVGVATSRPSFTLHLPVDFLFLLMAAYLIARESTHNTLS